MGGAALGVKWVGDSAVLEFVSFREDFPAELALEAAAVERKNLRNRVKIDSVSRARVFIQSK